MSESSFIGGGKAPLMRVLVHHRVACNTHPTLYKFASNPLHYFLRHPIVEAKLDSPHEFLLSAFLVAGFVEADAQASR